MNFWNTLTAISWFDFFSVKLSPNGKLVAEIGPTVVIIVFMAIIIALRGGIIRKMFSNHDIVKLNIKLGGIGEVEIKPNVEATQVAHRAWVELATRKAGIPFDEDNDVIVEVYDSWYQLFGEMRKLIKDVPAHRIREDQATRKTVDLLVKALNSGLRPHLTRWQARFRRWYADALTNNPGKTPQDIQRLYPEYPDLIRDLKIVNGHLCEYMEEIVKLVAIRSS